MYGKEKKRSKYHAIELIHQFFANCFISNGTRLFYFRGTFFRVTVSIQGVEKEKRQRVERMKFYIYKVTRGKPTLRMFP